MWLKLQLNSAFTISFNRKVYQTPRVVTELSPAGKASAEVWKSNGGGHVKYLPDGPAPFSQQYGWPEPQGDFSARINGTSVFFWGYLSLERSWTRQLNCSIESLDLLLCFQCKTGRSVISAFEEEVAATRQRLVENFVSKHQYPPPPAVLLHAAPFAQHSESLHCQSKNIQEKWSVKPDSTSFFFIQYKHSCFYPSTNIKLNSCVRQCREFLL